MDDITSGTTGNVEVKKSFTGTQLFLAVILALVFGAILSSFKVENIRAIESKKQEALTIQLLDLKLQNESLEADIDILRLDRKLGSALNHEDLKAKLLIKQEEAKQRVIEAKEALRALRLAQANGSIRVRLQGE